ncbi:MAG: hypothetical protein ABIF19_18070 [Planctomycetota bacterium]
MKPERLDELEALCRLSDRSEVGCIGCDHYNATIGLCTATGADREPEYGKDCWSWLSSTPMKAANALPELLAEIKALQGALDLAEQVSGRRPGFYLEAGKEGEE